MTSKARSTQSDDMPMRIAVVIESYNPQAGGNERSTSEIVQRLAERGHAVTVLSGEGDPAAIPEGADLRVSGRGRPKSALQLFAFRKWAMQQLADGRYDTSLSVTVAVPAAVVQPRGGTVRETLERNIAIRGTAASQLAKRLAIAINPKQRALLALEKKTLADPSLHAVAAVSGYVKRQLVEHYGLTDDEVVVIHNGASVPDLTDAEREEARATIRKAFQVPEDATLFVFAAQNPRLKGFGPLVSAMRRLKDAGHPFVVLFAGRYRYTHLSWLAKVGVRELARMVGPTDDMPTLYAAADVTVLPTFYDPASKVVLESLMLGTPAISTGYNGASDFIAPEGGPLRGRVVADPADDEALAEAMAELCDSGARRACGEAMEGVAEQVSMDRHVQELEQLLRRAGAAVAIPHEAEDAEEPDPE